MSLFLVVDASDQERKSFREDRKVVKGPLVDFLQGREGAVDALERALQRMSNRGWETVSISPAGQKLVAVFKKDTKTDLPEMGPQRGEAKVMYCGDSLCAEQIRENHNYQG